MTSVRIPSCLIALICIGGLLPSITIAQTIVWTDTNARKIQRRDISGGAISTIVEFPSGAASEIHYDSIAAKLYYFRGGFWRINIDGSEVENIPTPNSGTFAVNIKSRKLHWWTNAGFLYHSELDGTNVHSYFFNDCCVFGLEARGDTVYFGAGASMLKGIWRADADGSNAQFLHSTGAPFDLAFDPVENKVYMSALDKIIRINPDGSDYQIVVDVQNIIEHVEVDHRSRKLYWTEDGSDVIRRSNLDGTGVEDFVTAADVGNLNVTFGGLAVVDAPSIPALSDWGLAATGMLVLCTGIAVLKKRMHASRQNRVLSGVWTNSASCNPGPCAMRPGE